MMHRLRAALSMARLRTAARARAARTRTARFRAARSSGPWRRAVVPAAVLALTLGLAMPALAGTRERGVTHAAVSLRTLVGHVRIRTAPRNHAHIVATIDKSGTAVAVSCYTMGTSVAGNRVWYLITAPAAGYITSYYTATHLDPAVGVSKCKSFSRPYHTVVKGLHIRLKPTTYSKILTVLGAVGTTVTVSCYTDGQNVTGDAVWYHTLTPTAGYVAGLNLDTGYDPAPGVPKC